MPFNGMQDGTSYDGCPVGKNPKFTPLDNIPNRDVLRSLHFHCVLRRFDFKGKGNDDEEENEI